MKLMLPREHGAWAMWIAPFIIGIGITRVHWLHFLLLISIFFAYISISPFLQGIRKPSNRKAMWQLALTYFIIALITSIPILYFSPKLLYIVGYITPLFLISILYVKSKNERALLNDLLGIAALGSTFFAATMITTPLTRDHLLIYLLTLLYFLGSALYVKTIIRMRNNKLFKWLTNSYMILLPSLLFLFLNPYTAIAYLFSMVRAILTPFGSSLSPKKVGIIEIFNTLWFIIFMLIAF